jgi:hypothetical protein
MTKERSRNPRYGANTAPVVQQGPVPVFFVTGIAAMDIDPEVVVITFAADQRWGGKAVMERDLNLRMVMSRSDFDRMRCEVTERAEGEAAMAH